MQSTTETELIRLESALISDIDHGRPIPDITHILTPIVTARLTTKEKILLLNVIVLSQPTNAIFLNDGERIFEEVASDIMGLRQYKKAYATMELLLPRKRKKHNFLVDLHQPKRDQEGKAFESEQYESVGFTYFFLNKARNRTELAFFVDPGKGNHSSYYIHGFNPLRYAVRRYLEDMLPYSIPLLRGYIMNQLKKNSDYMMIPSSTNGFLNTQAEVAGLIRDVFEPYRPQARSTITGQATTDMPPIFFGIHARMGGMSQKEKKKLLGSPARAEAATRTPSGKDMKFFIPREEAKAETLSADDKKVEHNTDTLGTKPS